MNRLRSVLLLLAICTNVACSSGGQHVEAPSEAGSDAEANQEDSSPADASPENSGDGGDAGDHG